MLTELLHANQREIENGNGNGHAAVVEVAEAVEEEPEDELGLLEREPDEDTDEDVYAGPDPGAARRFRFRHPTASGKTIAAAGFVEAARTLGVLILTHRRLLVQQFNRDLTDEGYSDRFTDAIMRGQKPPRENPITIQTYAWFARHHDEISRDAYHLVIADEAHTALGEKTSQAIRSYHEPLYIGMTATEQLIAKQVSDVFPASVDDLPLAEAARRGLIAPLRSLRVPPVAAINNVPIIGGDFDQEELAKALDHQALNLAAASLYRERFENTPGIVYAAGVEHAYNLAQEFRAVGIKAEAVSGRTPPVKLAETLGAYERGEINVLINAMLLAEGWNSPRATVCMHLAPTASRRVYQQRIGRIMRMHPRKEAGIVVDFVPKAATHNERVVSLHSLLDADFYREGARVTPAPRRRIQRRAKRKLTPAPWLVPVTPDVRRRLSVIQREWQRVDPKYLDDDEQRFWASIAGQADSLRGAHELRREAHGRTRDEGCARAVPRHVRRREPQPAPADDGARRPRFDAGRARRLRRPRHARQLGADLGEGPPERDPHAAPCDRRGQGRRAGADPLALDVEARTRCAKGPGPQGEPGVPRGEATARRARELPRAPPRGERREARQHRARAPEARRRRAARLCGGVHPAGDEAARRGTRAARPDPGGRARARGEPPAAEDAAVAQAPPAAPQEEDDGRELAAAESSSSSGGAASRRTRSRPRLRRSRGRAARGLAARGKPAATAAAKRPPLGVFARRGSA